MSVRLIDCLCPRHAAEAEHQWPASGDLAALHDACVSCESATGRQFIGALSYSIRSLPTLSSSEYDDITAHHEIAHAVVGTVTGHPVNWVRIEARTDGLQTGFGGQVNLADYDVPVPDHLAMLWAGQQAQMRWLRTNGLDTAANRVDVRQLGWHDTSRALDLIAERRLPSDCGRGLCEELLDQHWQTITDAAAELARILYLSGDQVRAYVGCLR